MTLLRFLCFVALVCPDLIQGQEVSSSSFSSYHIGLLEQNTSLFQRMNGGAKNGYVSSENINLSNAAHTSLMDNTVFDVALRTKISQITESGVTGINQYTNFLYGALVLPIKERKWSLGLSLTPYSNMSYQNVIEKQSADSIMYKYTLNGLGGISTCRVFTSYHVQLDSTLHFSAGLEGQYYFGNVKKNKDFNTSSTYFLNIYSEENYALKGLGVQFSGLLLKTFKNKSFISIGGTYNPGFKAQITSQNLMYHYQKSPFSLPIKDTIQSLSETSKSSMPSKYSIGASVSFKSSFTLSADYEQQTWDSSSLSFDHTPLGAYKRWNVGFSYQIKPNPNKEFAPRLSIGYSQTQFPALIQGQALTATALHFGASIPLFGKLKSKTIFNFGTEFGRYNQIASVYQERYVCIFAGIVLSPSTYDKWFKQAKID